MNWKLEEFHSLQFCITLAKMDFLFLFTSSWQNDGSVIYSWEKTFLIYTSKRWWMNPSPPLFHWWWILTKWIFLLLLPLLISESKVALFFRNFLPNLHQSIFPLCSYMTRITWLKWEDFEVSTSTQGIHSSISKVHYLICSKEDQKRDIQKKKN